MGRRKKTEEVIEEVEVIEDEEFIEEASESVEEPKVNELFEERLKSLLKLAKKKKNMTAFRNSKMQTVSMFSVLWKTMI